MSGHPGTDKIHPKTKKVLPGIDKIAAEPPNILAWEQDSPENREDSPQDQASSFGNRQNSRRIAKYSYPGTGAHLRPPCFACSTRNIPMEKIHNSVHTDTMQTK